MGRRDVPMGVDLFQGLDELGFLSVGHRRQYMTPIEAMSKRFTRTARAQG